MLAASVSVARVRPRTSKGITDLLLPQTSAGFGAGCPSKKSTAILKRLTSTVDSLTPLQLMYNVVSLTPYKYI